MKPFAAREIEARDRARQLAVRIRCVTAGKEYTTHSRTTATVYHLRRWSSGWKCDCLGYQHTGCCKHLGQLERRAEREGWRFGAIAPHR